MTGRNLILGVDGGGTKTAVRIARVGDDGITVLGDGHAGPSNVHAVGFGRAAANLDEAVDAAIAAAATTDERIRSAVVALAGAGQPEVRTFVADWAARRSLADRVEVVHDVEPVLAAGLPDGYGVAMIAGTGSSVVGRNKDGERCETGGWGYWIGDQGSGFDLGRRGLAAVADAVDGVGPETTLVELICAQLEIGDPHEMPTALGDVSGARHRIASLVRTVLDAAAADDAVAARIVAGATRDIAQQVLAASRRLELPSDAPLAVAGGVVCGSELYRAALLGQLRELGLQPAAVTIVADPVEGSLVMARERLPAD